jgi:hypothetical protein
VVRRLGRRLGNVSRLFSDRASSRLSLRGRSHSPPHAKTPVCPSLGPASRQPFVAAHRPSNLLAFACADRSRLAHPRPAYIFHRPAVHPAQRHDPVIANVVRAPRFWPFAVPPLRTLQSRFPASASEFSVPDRAASIFPPTIHPLVVGIRPLRDLLLCFGVAQPQQRYEDIHSERVAPSNRGKLCAKIWGKASVAEPLGVRIDDAPRSDESPFAKCRASAALVGCSARTLSALVRCRICETPILFALVCSQTAGRRVGLRGLCHSRCFHHARHPDQRAAFLLGAFRGLSFLSWRTRSTKTDRALLDVVLLNHRIGRCSGRCVRWLARAACSFWDLRIARRSAAGRFSGSRCAVARRMVGASLLGRSYRRHVRGACGERSNDAGGHRRNDAEFLRSAFRNSKRAIDCPIGACFTEPSSTARNILLSRRTATLQRTTEENQALDWLCNTAATGRNE